MKTRLFILTACVSTICAMSAYADWSIDAGADTAIRDDGGCRASYSTTYKGVARAKDSDSEIGTVIVRETRSSRSAASSIAVLFKNAQGKRVLYSAKKCAIPGPFTATHAVTNGVTQKMHCVITWDYFVGTDENGNQYLAAKNGNVEDIEIDPKVALIGYHSLALEAIYQTNESDFTSLGYAAVSLNIKKTGRYSAAVKMPNGWSFSASGKATSDGTNTYCRVSRNRKSGGGRETVSFTIVVNNLSQAVSVADVSDWVSTSKKWPINATLEFVAGGNPETTTTEYKKFEKQILADDIQLVLKTTKLTQKSGLVSGSFYYYVPNSKGKLKKKTGKVIGVDVNGEVYGSAYASNLWSYPFEATALETDDDGEEDD